MLKSLDLMTYSPPRGYAIDVEVLSFAELRQRATTRRLQAPHRVGFHHLMVVTQGHCTHLLDFETMACPAGTWLLVKSGQVHAFDATSDWQGWLVVFKPEILPALERLTQGVVENDICEHLPKLMTMSPQDHSAGLACLTQMRSDVMAHRAQADANPLVWMGLYHLLVRLWCSQKGLAKPVSALVQARFSKFKAAVESKLPLQRHVHDYARDLACSEKTLNRAVLEACGLSAKQYLVQRMLLQAKRQLVHSSKPVGVIAIELGFDEATNFVKFFKRESGMPPQAFRQLYAPIDPGP